MSNVQRERKNKVKRETEKQIKERNRKTNVKKETERQK